MDAREEIKSRLPIEDVVGRYVDLKRSGSTYKGLCPFHQEKTPSFHVTPARGTFHCFGCGRGGDVFTFVMEMDRLSFPDALKRLAEQAGVALPERERRTPSLSKQLYEANAAASAFFHELLSKSPGRRALDYLSSRSFGADAVDHFELGYAPAGRDTLIAHLRSAGFEDRILLAAGLAIQDDIGGNLRDRFRARLIFPIRDQSGRVTGFGGRILDDGQPKYLNSPQTETFDKSGALYGIYLAADAIRASGRAVLVEGYLDAVRAHLGGYREVVASLGTAVTTRQLAGLSRLTSTVVLALDPDPAGQAAAARTALTALAELTSQRGRSPGSAATLNLLVARLPAGHGDPDDLIREAPALWEEAIATAIPAFDFYFARTMDSLDRSSDTWRQEAIDTLLPLIQQFATSTGWQATWIQRLAGEAGVDVAALQRTLPSAQRPRRAPGPARSSPAPDAVSGTTTRALASDPADEVERRLIAFLLRVVVVPDGAAGELSTIQLRSPELRSVLAGLLAWRERRNYDFQMLRDSLPSEVQELADELYALREPVSDAQLVSVAVDYYLTRLRHFRLLGQLRRASEAASEMGSEDETSTRGSLAQLIIARREVEEQLDRLSRLVAQDQPRGQGTIDQEAGSW